MANRPPLTIPEAAAALAVSEKTIRRMLKAGLLHEQTRDAGGRIFIDAASIETAAAQLERKVIGWPDAPISTSASITPYVSPDTLQPLVDAFAAQIRERDERIFSLQGEIATLRAEQKYLPRLTETELARMTELEQSLADARAELARLRGDAQTTDQTSTQDNNRSLISKILRFLRSG